MNNKELFKKFYLEIAFKNLQSYKAHFNESNFDENISELISKFQDTYGVDPFDIKDPKKITEYLKENKEPFYTYSDKKGTNIPNALLNKHYNNFLNFYDKNKFADLQDLINVLHDAFGLFSRTFQDNRIKLNGNSRVASSSIIFGDVRDDYWTINKGSESEIQYHVFKHHNKIGYGLGFNAQKTRNNLDAVENVSKFIGAFIREKKEIDVLLEDYQLIDNTLDSLLNIKEGEFILFGRDFPFVQNANNIEIEEFKFLQIYYDLRYRQFSAYKKIYQNAIDIDEPLNKTIEKNKMKELLEYKKQIILQGPPGTGKTREAELIAKEMLGLSDIKDLENNNQYKLVQFHPSYTYEDFVRGISAQPSEDGKGVLYKAENKTLSLFAQEAYKNYEQSTKTESQISYKDWINEQFDSFVDKVQDSLDNDGEYRLSDKVKLCDLDDSSFYYTGDSWFGEPKHRMKFSDIKEGFINNVVDAKSFKALPNTSGSAKQHYGYYYKVLSDFQNSIKTEFKNENKSLLEPKNYVLVIDEINRANLSSVLGELIYALEYREKAVESMYSVEDSVLDNKNQIILPPNLYIIGTMNTADRSVGHIDYAIRRRFAFVDVLPEELDDEKIVFQKELFKKVSALFINNYEAYIADKNTKLEQAKTLAAEFRPEDVWLGHSYFIQTKEKDKDGKDILVPEDFNIRLEYEIKPILMEYVKDGILINTIKDGESEIKVEDYIKAL